jgi:hypothetical protein
MPIWAYAGQLSASGGCYSYSGPNIFGARVECESTDSPFAPGTTLGGGRTDGIAAANYSVRANYGSVAATVLAGTAASPGDIRANAFASSFVAFTDQVKVTSDVLAPGTPVTVQFSLFISASAMASDTSEGWADMSGRAGISNSSGIYKQLDICNYGRDCANPVSATRSVYNLSFDTAEGETLSLYLGMYNFAYASVLYYQPGAEGNPTRFSFSTATAELYLSASNVSFIGSTGHTYMNPVPEPDTYAMTLLGLLAIGLNLKRKNIRR